MSSGTKSWNLTLLPYNFTKVHYLYLKKGNIFCFIFFLMLKNDLIQIYYQ